MKNSIYMLCLGLLFAHSLQPGNICCGMKDSSEGRKEGLEQDALNPRHLKELYPKSEENNRLFNTFTEFVEERHRKDPSDREAVRQAAILLSWAVNSINVELIKDKSGYDCWRHNVGILAALIATHNNNNNVSLSDDHVRKFYSSDSSLIHRLFSTDQSGHGLSHDAIVAWLNGVEASELNTTNDPLSDASTDISTAHSSGRRLRYIATSFSFSNPRTSNQRTSVASRSLTEQQFAGHPHAIDEL